MQVMHACTLMDHMVCCTHRLYILKLNRSIQFKYFIFLHIWRKFEFKIKRDSPSMSMAQCCVSIYELCECTCLECMGIRGQPPGLRNEASADVPKVHFLKWPLDAGA